MKYWKNLLDQRLYNLDYEALVEEQESEIQKLLHYIGLDWDSKCLSPENNQKAVTTASSLQVRKKIYKGSSHEWKKYEPFLNGAFDSLN